MGAVVAKGDGSQAGGAAVRQQQQQQQQQPAVAVFKTARSGSTWLATLLRSQMRLAVHDEIIHASSGESTPTLELTTKMRAKLLRGESFTVNPKNTPCVNYTDVVASVPGVRVVAFERCNTIKHALSYLRTPAVANACGGVKSRNCKTLPAVEAFTPFEFRNAIVCTYERSALARHAAASTGLPVHEVIYESLQRDVSAELNRLSPFLLTGRLGGKPRRKLVSKTGSDNVSSLLLNPRELRGMLAPYSCLLELFEDTDSGRCLRCPNPWPDVACDREQFEKYAFSAPALHSSCKNASSQRWPSRAAL